MEIVKYGVEISDSKLNVLVKENTYNYGSQFFNKPGIIVDMLNTVFHAGRQAEEHVWLLAINNSCEVLGVFEVCHGSVSEASVHMREIFVRLCLCGATGFILAHNHPGNSLAPSEADIRMTGIHVACRRRIDKKGVIPILVKRGLRSEVRTQVIR